MLPIPLQSPKSEHPLLPPKPINDPTLSDPQSDVSLLYCLPQLFSDHELARSPSPQISKSNSPSAQSLVGTSAPLLTHPSLTDYLSNYPIWPNRAEDSSLSPSRPASPSCDEAPPAVSKPPTAPSIKRGSGRPSKKTRAPRQRKFEDKTAPTAPKPTVPKPTALKPDAQTGSQDRYRLRLKKQPRYKCGTCGSCDCVCVLTVHENREVPIGARDVPPGGQQNEELVHRIVVREEKTFSGVKRTDNHPVATILQQITTPNVAKAPYSRFKEWTNDGKGLEFTFSTVVPPLPPNFVFGPFNFEREPVQMARCITADLLLD